MAIQYALKVFEYENKRPFRIIDRNGEPWFVLGGVDKLVDARFGG